MLLTKEELVSTLRGEVRILNHLLTKTGIDQLSYRPSEKQRSTLELLEYLSVMPGIHLRAIVEGKFEIESWKAAWTNGLATAKKMDFEGLKSAIADQETDLAALLAPLTDQDLQAEIDLFGKASRVLAIIRLVLNHYVAYRMQLFLYLKSSGREELGTLNLWRGSDTF